MPFFQSSWRTFDRPVTVTSVSYPILDSCCEELKERILESVQITEPSLQDYERHLRSAHAWQGSPGVSQRVFDIPSPKGFLARP